MEPKRLFVAIPVTGALEQAVLGWQADHLAWPVKWLKADNLHITVVSPWLEDDIDSVVSKLEGFVDKIKKGELDIRPFDLRFFKIVFGPNRFSPRLVWAEGQSPVQLLELKNRLEQALAKPDGRFFRLHLTLGRFKLEDFGPAGLPDLFDRIDWGQEVKSFALFESILADGQAEYKKIREFSL